jgi:hypothetical protein
MPASEMRMVLVLHGSAHVLRGSHRVKLRTRGLALLCILALDGPTRRERVADLLWDHVGAADNLRVELHRLREALASSGVRGFPAGRNPLELPAEIEVDRAPRLGTGQPLEGFDDLSDSFQVWLETQRSLFAVEQDRPRLHLRQRLVDEVARQVVQPYVLVLKGGPGSGRREFASALAGRLGLPVTETVEAAAPAVHVLEAHEVDAEQAARQVLRQRAGVWVLAETAFGRESALLLLLRKLYPPERMRFIELDGLPWHEARSLVLCGLGFEEAARLHATTGGHMLYMRELLRLRPEQGFGVEAPLPQRIRASYLLEARRLPDATRTVLEQLSVHPGALPDPLLTGLGFTEHLDALEESGWLRFDGNWSYRDEVSRRVVYRCLQPGRRTHYHAKLAAAFAEIESESGTCATHHRVMAARNGAPGAPSGERAASTERATTDEAADDPEAVSRGAPSPRVRATCGRELALLLERHVGLQVGEGDEWWSWARRARDTEPSFAVFTLPDGPCLIHAEARWYVERIFVGDAAAQPYPLWLRFRGGPRPERQVVFLDVAPVACLEDGTLLLPERAARFACDHRTLIVETRLETGIVEFRLRAFDLVPGHGVGKAYDLVAPPGMTCSER